MGIGLQRAVVQEENGRGLSSETGNARNAIRGVADEGQPIGNALWVDAISRSHALGVDNAPTHRIELYDAVNIVDALTEVLVWRQLC